MRENTVYNNIHVYIFVTFSRFILFTFLKIILYNRLTLSNNSLQIVAHLKIIAAHIINLSKHTQTVIQQLLITSWFWLSLLSTYVETPIYSC